MGRRHGHRRAAPGVSPDAPTPVTPTFHGKVARRVRDTPRTVATRICPVTQNPFPRPLRARRPAVCASRLSAPVAVDRLVGRENIDRSRFLAPLSFPGGEASFLPEFPVARYGPDPGHSGRSFRRRLIATRAHKKTARVLPGRGQPLQQAAVRHAHCSARFFVGSGVAIAFGRRRPLVSAPVSTPSRRCCHCPRWRRNRCFLPCQTRCLYCHCRFHCHC